MDLLLVLVPLVVTIVFRRTPLGWVPGLVLVLVGIASLADGGSGGDSSGIGSGWGAAIGMFALLYAAICLAIAGYSHATRAAAATPPAGAPPFVVVVPPAPPEHRPSVEHPQERR